MSSEPKELGVDLYYPRAEVADRTNEQPQQVRINLECIRSANSIVIDYDFERDGYRVRMPSKFSWNAGEEIDEQLKEVSFIPAWASGDPPGIEQPE